MTDETQAVLDRVRAALEGAHDSHPICNQSGYALGYESEPTGGDGWWMTVADLRALCAEVERLRGDERRLDWLEGAAREDDVEVAVGFSREGYEPGEYGAVLSSWPDEYWLWACDNDARGPTLRAAIDAARVGGQP